MTLADKIRSRFGISDDCVRCKRKKRECYNGYISLNDLCEVLHTARKKPVLVVFCDGNHAVGNCPCCNEMIVKGYSPNYCGKCGQAVEWE